MHERWWKDWGIGKTHTVEAKELKSCNEVWKRGSFYGNMWRKA